MKKCNQKSRSYWRQDKSSRSGASALVWITILAGVAGVVLAASWLWTRQVQRTQAPVEDITQLQGEPILPINTNPAALGPASNRFGFTPGSLTNLAELAQTNAVIAEVTGLASAEKSKRRRSKLGSYPKRLMDLQLRMISEGKDPKSFETNGLPAGFTLTNLPPPQVEGYLPVSFATLAGFEFQLRPEVVQGRTNTQALAQLPPEVVALNGRKAAVSGFLLPIRMDEGLAVEFLLMRDQTLCCFGRVPSINEWISVKALGRGAQPRMDIPITVCGNFTVTEKREGGTLIGLYEMEAEKIIESQ